MKPLALLATVAVVALAGCQTPHVFPAPRENWVTYAGQLRHSSQDRSVIGSVVVSFVPVHNFHLDFLGGPGFPLLQLREDRTAALAEGALARGRWTGRAEEAPDALVPWFRLHEVFNQLAARQWPARAVTIDSLTPGLWTAQVTGKNARPATVDVRFRRTGDRFQFVFQDAR